MIGVSIVNSCTMVDNREIIGFITRIVHLMMVSYSDENL